MKKIKGLIAVVLILTVMIGSTTFVAASNDLTNNKPINGEYTTLGDPNPIGF